MDVPAPPDDYRFGVSLYAAAWPLLKQPLRDLQIGLASIWIVPDNRSVNYPLLPKGTLARDNWPERGPSYRDVFQTIEGGLGFWASTRFGSPTAKFRMNGTPDGYNHEISTPGWGFEQIDALPADQMGIAQLSSRILVPPDGLTFREGTNGELLGYAWMALPLTKPKTSTAGLPIPTGNQCWTLFVNTKNAKGPIAFYAPATWSRISLRHAPAIARGLDARPGLVTGGAIEVNTVPRYVGKDSNGATYTRVPRLQFPVDKDGSTVLVHNLTQYSKNALYRQVKSWLEGGKAVDGHFDRDGGITPTVTANPLELRQGPKNLPIKGFENLVETKALDRTTFGLQWKREASNRGFLPEYFKESGKSISTVEADAVPDETGLKAAEFPGAQADGIYTSPGNGDNAWHKPGPKAGPFHARLTDGSVVTYYWYRFIDQPSLQNADLSPEERQHLQLVAEKIQSRWTLQKTYIPPPTRGNLAELDPALLVKPPRGLEVGYVPVAVRQAASK